MAMDITRFQFVSFDRASAYNNAKELEWRLKDITGFEMSGEEETLDINGRLGKLLMSIKRNKSLNINITNGMLNGGLLASQMGSEVETGEFEVMMTGSAVVNTNTATIEETITGTPGYEIGTIYVETGANLGKVLKQVGEEAELETGQFTFDPDLKTLTFFAGDVPDGSTVTYDYTKTVSGQRIRDNSEDYAGVVELRVDATVKDLCDGMYHAQIIARRYEVSGTFTWSFNDSAMAHDLSGRCMAAACTGGEEYVDIIVFTDEA